MFVTATESVAKPPKYKIAPCVRLTTSAAIVTWPVTFDPPSPSLPVALSTTTFAVLPATTCEDVAQEMLVWTRKLTFVTKGLATVMFEFESSLKSSPMSKYRMPYPTTVVGAKIVRSPPVVHVWGLDSFTEPLRLGCTMIEPIVEIIEQFASTWMESALFAWPKSPSSTMLFTVRIVSNEFTMIDAPALAYRSVNAADCVKLIRPVGEDASNIT
jgi:hypothetical protein